MSAATVALASSSSPAIGRARRFGVPAGEPAVTMCSAWIELNALTTCDAGRRVASSSLGELVPSSISA